MKISDKAYSKNIEADLLEQLNDAPGPNHPIQGEVWIDIEAVDSEDKARDGEIKKELMDIVGGQQFHCTPNPMIGVATFRFVTAGQVIQALEKDFVTGGIMAPRGHLRGSSQGRGA